MTGTQTITKPIECGACGKFETMYGDEMYSHYMNKHDIVFSGMKYQYGWAVGTGNTYAWLHSHDLVLDAEHLRKCNNCNTPFIAYDHKDDCDECRKLPEIAIFQKYSRNEASYTEPADSIYYAKKLICDNCGHLSESYEAHHSHGDLVTLEDETLRYVC